MKKLFKPSMVFVTVVMMLGVVLAGCGSSTGGSKKEVVNIMNWSEYLPEHLIKQFEEETGIKVNYSEISSNEEMIAKLNVSGGEFDLAVPSTYFVEPLIKQDKLEKIDKDNIPNLKYIGEDYLGWDFDKNDEYSLPYMSGTEIIIVNEKLVDKEVKSYRDLFDPEFKDSLVILDDPRTMLSAMLSMLGYDPNTTKEEEIVAAGEELKKLKPNIKVYDSDNAKNLLISNEVKAGVVYGAEAALAMRENPDLKAIIPEDFLSLWQDNFVIPKGAKNKENAEKFINFIYDPEVSKEIVLEHPYVDPNEEAVKLLPDDVRAEIEMTVGDGIDHPKAAHAIDVGEALQVYDRVWSEVKQ
ncbi:spermidine/putrescine ABC transporter substrate-binding protein [Siminovitchia fortis]|uniref:Spermidine/putrescine ABC transporter substrate-binding protein n=1 Tax=Siminovitchia fortis TaxID=254758 RepID=A0A443ILS6_9BACI|nr:spermidine/putrescine ABC transporter substrate-binding protein [Siminovitchia fortis]RWR06120.1 spermidine/putrescine ABC transporter substrate-binding protein [Siminovitchia fortis]WHY81553.1 spermidine/putrescine ABC transporter substrate-binding protein [Siminovitchia fortis]